MPYGCLPGVGLTSWDGDGDGVALGVPAGVLEGSGRGEPGARVPPGYGGPFRRDGAGVAIRPGRVTGMRYLPALGWSSREASGWGARVRTPSAGMPTWMDGPFLKAPPMRIAETASMRPPVTNPVIISIRPRRSIPVTGGDDSNSALCGG